MSQGWSKLFSRINWFNRPIKATPVGATNLNKNDYALDKIDDRVITLDAIKADKIEINANDGNHSLMKMMDICYRLGLQAALPMLGNEYNP